MSLEFQYREAPLSPAFASLADGLELNGNISDVELFKYFLNDDEIDMTSSDGGSPQSFNYDSSSSSPPVPSPPDYESPRSSPSPVVAHLIDILPSPSPNTTTTSTHPTTLHPSALLSSTIKKEPMDDYEGGYDKKRKIKQEGGSARPQIVPVAIVPKNNDASSNANPEEERHVKRQRRLIKNRESAQLSRMRKKIYIDELEKKVSILTQDNDALTKKVASLVHDNSQLTEQVNYLQNMLKQQHQVGRKAVVNSVANNRNLKTAGVCMLMILFSFGLFFNIKSGEKYREQPFHVGRMLTSIDEEQVTAALPAHSGSASSLEQPAVAMIPKRDLHRKRALEDSEPKAAVVKKKEEDSPVAPRRKIIKIQKQKEGRIEDEPEAGLVPLQQQVPAPVDASTIPHLTQSIVRRPETNYIYCSQPQNVFPDNVRSDEHGRIINHPFISLLVPADNLNATFAGSGYGAPESNQALLEITCQIMNINVYPMIPLSNNSQTVS